MYICMYIYIYMYQHEVLLKILLYVGVTYGTDYDWCLCTKKQAMYIDKLANEVLLNVLKYFLLGK